MLEMKRRKQPTLCMGHASGGTVSFPLDNEGFTRAELNRADRSFSRRRDFTVPFSKRHGHGKANRGLRGWVGHAEKVRAIRVIRG